MIELNRIYNEDCLDGMKAVPDNSIDLIVTDPPYRTTSRGNHGNSGGMLKKQIVKDGNVFKYNDILPREYIPEFYRILKDGTHFYIMTNHVNLIQMLNVCTEIGFHFTKSLIWNKVRKIMGTHYMGQFEYILFFRKGASKQINNCGTSDILEIPIRKSKDINGQNLHDTEKPVELMETLINNSSQENEIVLDPFMGSGTTAIACINTNRNYIGFELDKHYCDIANERIQKTLAEKEVGE